jgi:hypothetical protein
MYLEGFILKAETCSQNGKQLGCNAINRYLYNPGIRKVMALRSIPQPGVGTCIKHKWAQIFLCYVSVHLSKLSGDVGGATERLAGFTCVRYSYPRQRHHL